MYRMCTSEVDDEDDPRDDVDGDRDARVGRRPRERDDDRQDRREHERHPRALLESGELLEALPRSARRSANLAARAHVCGSGTTRHDSSSCDASTCRQVDAGSAPAAVRAGEYLEQMAVGIGEVHAPSAVVVIDLPELVLHRIGPVVDADALGCARRSRRTRPRSRGRRSAAARSALPESGSRASSRARPRRP